MNLQQRINILVRLGKYMLSEEGEWLLAKEKAERENAWFSREFIDLAVQNIAERFLQQAVLEKWVAAYSLTGDRPPRKVGIVMAGNIPLVGFHDFLSVFISGNLSLIKPSSKDNVLIRHLAEKITVFDPGAAPYIGFSELLKDCDAYIATGSNNSSRYFEYYFGKYPGIIRKNRTSAAVLNGTETREDLEKLSDDVHLYFGMGCRNVTKLYVPEGYDFIPLLDAFKKYAYFSDHHKYKNNYDYNLAIHILNNRFYMTNGSIILYENESLFSPISQLHYEYYTAIEQVTDRLRGNEELQGVVGRGFIPFGAAQCPAVDDYADGVDTLAFLQSL